MHKIIAATTILLLASGIAHAEGGKMSKAHGEARQEFLKAVDADADGNITEHEFKAFSAVKSAERFKKLDANGDGNISEAEYAAASEGKGRAFAKFDKNGDGIINEADRKSKDAPGEVHTLPAPAEPAVQ